MKIVTYIKSKHKALWFQRRFVYVFPMTPPGWGLYRPYEHGLQDL